MTLQEQHEDPFQPEPPQGQRRATMIAGHVREERSDADGEPRLVFVAMGGDPALLYRIAHAHEKQVGPCGGDGVQDPLAGGFVEKAMVVPDDAPAGIVARDHGGGGGDDDRLRAQHEARSCIAIGRGEQRRHEVGAIEVCAKPQAAEACGPAHAGAITEYELGAVQDVTVFWRSGGEVQRVGVGEEQRARCRIAERGAGKSYGLAEGEIVEFDAEQAIASQGARSRTGALEKRGAAGGDLRRQRATSRRRGGTRSGAAGTAEDRRGVLTSTGAGTARGIGRWIAGAG